jgi:hypothetical protein
MNIDITKEERIIILQMFNDVQDKWGLHENEITLMNRLRSIKEEEDILEQIPVTEPSSICYLLELLQDDALTHDFDFIITQDDINQISLLKDYLNKKYTLLYKNYKEMCDDYGKNNVTDTLAFDIQNALDNGFIEEIKD